VLQKNLHHLAEEQQEQITLRGRERDGKSPCQDEHT
jgi:hypothetical protein